MTKQASKDLTCFSERFPERMMYDPREKAYVVGSAGPVYEWLTRSSVAVTVGLLGLSPELGSCEAQSADTEPAGAPPHSGGLAQ